VEILRANLDALAEDLTAGSVVIFESARLLMRRLFIGGQAP
jgi:hypothetical protein